MQELSGTLRKIRSDSALEIPVPEGTKVIGLFRAGQVSTLVFAQRKARQSVEHVLPEKRKNHWKCGEWEADTDHGSPVHPKTSLSRVIVSSTQALKVIGGNSL